MDLLITSQLLYQLSYAGNVARILQNLIKKTSEKMSKQINLISASICCQFRALVLLLKCVKHM
ncbi:hypothetical protein ACI8B_20192 [Acinetobacter proteolyticus]|uniref:Uncharacterized protein n=1 Tax=Acinetobacter proteolyticus TaxID=1776741 RepID=A0A653K4C1_9GAMM|nr:hypothetical protein ACI8B_20192 [Acinetobacter proteolyticus]